METDTELSYEGTRIYSADVASVITDVKTQLMDGVHPNNTGYKLIGEYWAGLIDSYLKEKPAEDKTYKVADLVDLQKYILGVPSAANSDVFLEKYDMNKDNTVDIFDVVLLRKELIKNS